MPSVLQPWVQDLTYMQQSVLISSVRGADGLHKEHVSKYILRWLRRCVLVSAFEGRVLDTPTQLGGGSFTGPLKAEQVRSQESADGVDYTLVRDETDDEVLARVFKTYLRATDEIPHHFHAHVMHAAQIIGIHHPVEWIRKSWYGFYELCVHDMHLTPELPQEMNRRLGDSEKQWRAREAVPALDVPKPSP